MVIVIERLSADDRLLLQSDKVWPQDVGVILILDAGPLVDVDGRLRIDVARKAVAGALPGLPRLRQVLGCRLVVLAARSGPTRPHSTSLITCAPAVASNPVAMLACWAPSRRSAAIGSIRPTLCGRSGCSPASTLVEWGCSCGCTTSSPTGRRDRQPGGTAAQPIRGRRSSRARVDPRTGAVAPETCSATACAVAHTRSATGSPRSAVRVPAKDRRGRVCARPVSWSAASRDR